MGKIEIHTPSQVQISATVVVGPVLQTVRRVVGEIVQVVIVVVWSVIGPAVEEEPKKVMVVMMYGMGYPEMPTATVSATMVPIATMPTAVVTNTATVSAAMAPAAALPAATVSVVTALADSVGTTSATVPGRCGGQIG